MLHQLLQISLDLVRGFATAAVKWRQCFARNAVALIVIDLAEFVVPRKTSRELAGTFSKNHDVGKGISTKPVRAIDSGRAFSRGKQSRHARHLRVRIDVDSAHR